MADDPGTQPVMQLRSFQMVPMPSAWPSSCSATPSQYAKEPSLATLTESNFISPLTGRDELSSRTIRGLPPPRTPPAPSMGLTCQNMTMSSTASV